MARNIGGEDPNLAIGDLARRAGLLAADAAGSIALFQKAGFIEHQHRIRIGQRFQRIGADDVTQGISISRDPTEDRLLPPGTLVAGSFCPHPSGLLTFVYQQAIESQPGRRRNPFLREQHPHPRHYIPKRRAPQIKPFLNRQSRHP